jgi:anti-sigma factor ChrR (cupin superfamily)
MAEAAAAQKPQAIANLARGGWRDLAFAPFREGVEMCRLVDSGADAASVAVLRYRPGASVPLHLHHGLETVLVLDGVQSDERGSYRPGDVVFNRAGTSHSVWSKEGCVVLIQWERPVEILEETEDQRAKGVETIG